MDAGDAGTPTDGGQPLDASDGGTPTDAGSDGGPDAGRAFVRALGAGNGFACALRWDNTVRCWGDGTNGKLGDGLETSSSTPTTVSGLSDAVALAVGATSACAQHSSDQTLSCWGENPVGAFGYTTVGGWEDAPAATIGFGAVTQFAFGWHDLCAIHPSGGTVCAGDSSYGQTSGGVPRALGLTLGNGYACEWLTRSADCWGHNDYGQLGGGSPVTGLTDVVQMAASTYGATTCARGATGLVSCWGRNLAGAVGDGTTTDRASPTATSVTDATTIAVGGFHVCSLGIGGALSCWGLNTNGQFGDGTNENSLSPIIVPGVPSFLLLTAGDLFTCGATADAVYCWGHNDHGQLGNGTLTDSSTPVIVTGL